jgi:hypothetical protein
MAHLDDEADFRTGVEKTRSASGEAACKAILSEEIDWEAFAAFPASACLAVVVGQPSQPGLYTIRVKAPHGVKLSRRSPKQPKNDSPFERRTFMRM